MNLHNSSNNYNKSC